MALSITTIQGSDNVGLSRLTINTNFAAVKAVSDAVTALLDPDAQSLTGIKLLQVDNAASALSSAIFSVSKSATILGNLSTGSVGASTSVSIKGTGGVSVDSGNLTVGLGNVTLSGTSSLLNANGAVSFNGEIRVPGVATAFINTVGLTSSTTTSIPVAGLKYIVVSTVAPNATGLTATLTNGTQGQEIEIYHAIGASGAPVFIDATNFVGLTGRITMQATGDKIKCIYDTTGWYLWDQVSGTNGSTSIVITRI